MSNPTVIGTYGTMYYVNDMKKSVAYYKDHLGFTQVNESEGWSEFSLPGGNRLCLHGTDANTKKPQNGIMILEVKKLPELVKKMKANGAEFAGDIHPVHPGAHSIDFRDPSGNVVSLYEDTNKN